MEIKNCMEAVVENSLSKGRGRKKSEVKHGDGGSISRELNHHINKHA